MSIKIMNMVFESYPVGGGEMLLALSLADFADDDGGRIFPSVPTLARKTRQSERNVQYQIRKMEQAGFISSVEKNSGGRLKGKKYKSNEYRINIGFFAKFVKGEIIAPLAKGCKTSDLTVQKKDLTVQNDAGKGAIAVAPNSPCNNPPCNNSPIKPPLLPTDPAQPTDTAGGGCIIQLIYPQSLSISEQKAVERMVLVDKIPPALRQPLLDELAGAIQGQTIKRGIVPFTHGLVTKAKAGQFTPSLGISVANARLNAKERRSQEALAMKQFELHPEAMKVGEQMLAAARKKSDQQGNKHST